LGIYTKIRTKVVIVRSLTKVYAVGEFYSVGLNVPQSAATFNCYHRNENQNILEQNWL